MSRDTPPLTALLAVLIRLWPEQQPQRRLAASISLKTCKSLSHSISVSRSATGSSLHPWISSTIRVRWRSRLRVIRAPQSDSPVSDRKVTFTLDFGFQVSDRFFASSLDIIDNPCTLEIATEGYPSTAVGLTCFAGGTFSPDFEPFTGSIIVF